MKFTAHPAVYTAFLLVFWLIYTLEAATMLAVAHLYVSKVLKLPRVTIIYSSLQYASILTTGTNTAAAIIKGIE